jgi:hypothetical protein
LTSCIKNVYLKTYEGGFPDKMLALLLSLSFNFDSIPSPQFAGDSFCVIIHNVDSTNLACSLSVIPKSNNLEICGEDASIINITEGKWEGWVKIYNITDSVMLQCKELKSKKFSLSNKFEVTLKENLSQLRQTTTSDSINIYPNPLTPEHTGTSINYSLSESAHVSIMIFDKFGNPVWETETDETAGTAHIDWDGTDNDGNRVFSGTYIICIKATNQTQTIAQYSGKLAVIR